MKHPTTVEDELAVKPRTVRFTLDVLEVECPRCHKHTRFSRPSLPPASDEHCPHCLNPWRWT